MKPLLERVQSSSLGKTFNRLDISSICLYGQECTRLDGLAIKQDRAGAAVTGVAADVRPGKSEFVTDKVNQKQPRLNIARIRLAVYCYGNGLSRH